MLLKSLLLKKCFYKFLLLVCLLYDLGKLVCWCFLSNLLWFVFLASDFQVFVMVCYLLVIL